MANISVLAAGAGAANPTSEINSTQQHTLGTWGVDDSHNVYVYVDFQESAIVGEWMTYNASFAASQLTSGTYGPCGIVVGIVSASDRFGWLQVYGSNASAWGTSDVTSATPLIVAATTDLGHVAAQLTSVEVAVAIRGAISYSAADTCASTALSTSALAAPFSVWLNFPYTDGTVSNISS